MCTRGSLTLAEINETFSDQAVKVEAEWRFSVWIKWLRGGERVHLLTVAAACSDCS